MHQRDPERISTGSDERDPIVRRAPIPMTGLAHIPERILLRRAPDNFFAPDEPELECDHACDRQNEGSAGKRSAGHGKI
jgi:hypothetical protein